MMLHIPDVLTRQQVTAIRTAIDAADWVDGRATAGSQGARVKRNRQLPEDSPVALEQGRTIEQALAANALYFSAALPARTMSPLFNRYAGDANHYGRHVDAAVMHSRADGQRVVDAESGPNGEHDSHANETNQEADNYVALWLFIPEGNHDCNHGEDRGAGVQNAG